MFTFNEWKFHYPQRNYETTLQRAVNMYGDYLFNFKTHRIIIEGIKDRYHPGVLTVSYIRARIPKDVSVVSTSSDHSLVYEYLVKDGVLFKKTKSSEIKLNRIVLNHSGIDRALTLVVDDGRIFVDSRHAPPISGDPYSRTRFQYLLDYLNYPQDSFTKIYRRGLHGTSI